MNLLMIGTGYVGLVTGLGFAKLGHRVVCVDKNTEKISRLELGETPFYERDLPELLHEMQEAGRLLFTTDIGSVIGSADVIVIAVQTPPRPFGEPNLSYIFAAADEIGAFLDHEALIVTKSTLPVGTNGKILEHIQAGLRRSGREDLTSLIQIASLPEFLSQGNALHDFFHPSRIVIGTEDDVSYQTLVQLHEGIEAPMIQMSVRNAELVKLAANAFLATKISFINEIAQVAERTGGDVRVIAQAIGLDPRIGPHFFRAGIGYGGSCFPKDVSALHHLSGINGYEFKLLSAVIEVNNKQREFFFQKIESVMGSVRGRSIGVWGLAFKQGTDDTRESIAINMVERLFARGADVKVYDPEAMDTAKRLLSPHIEFAGTAIDAATGTEALLVLTEWPEFRNISFQTLKTAMVEPRIFDGRNLLSDMQLSRLGFDYYGVGF